MPGNNGAVCAYEIGGVRRRAVGAPDRVVHLVHEHRCRYPLFGNGLSGQIGPLVVRLWLGDRAARFIGAVGAGPLPVGIRTRRTGGMRVNGVDNDEVKPVTVFLEQVVIGGAPLPERRSGEGAKDHHHRFLGEQAGQAGFASVNVLQSEVDRLLPGIQPGHDGTVG